MRPSRGAAILSVATTLVIVSVVGGVVVAGRPDATAVSLATAPPVERPADRVAEMGPDARPVMNPCHACHP